MIEELLKEAAKEALIGIKNKDGGPFGAVITDKEGNIVGRGHNMVIKNNDPNGHAEVMAIRDACSRLGTHDLSDYYIYSSCEPCPMCLSAIIWANIKKVYYGNTKEDADEIGFRDDYIYQFIDDLADDKMNKRILNLKCLERDEAIKVFEKFDKKDDKTIY